MRRVTGCWPKPSGRKASLKHMKPLPTLQPTGMLVEPLEIEDVKRMQDEVRALAREQNAVILAHNYQVPEVQDVADFVGDSLALAQEAAKTEADVIAFCGVHFMAETAAIVNPDKRVLIPDLDAGCSLSDSITADEVRAWKAQHPGAVVVMYVNTTAEVKAETDYCCTSSNAVKVVEQIPEDREILFGPDMFLGTYIENVTGRKMKVWMGECHVHAGIKPGDINALRAANPDAEFLIHPECGCTTQCVYYMGHGDIESKGTKMLSTSGMMREARESDAKKFIVATETGILYRMKKENPDKEFIPANPDAVCKYMKMITLPKLRDSLRKMQYEVKVKPEIAARARLSIERMLAIT